MKELTDRTILRNSEKINEIVDNFVEQLIEDVLNNINQQL
tara:strand:- start:484 stop:603 length:120 start_codon:yes stop_codon:yes gene_type:complete